MDDSKPRNLVISGLIKQRRDIQAKADYLTRELFALQENVAALDKAILVIDPTFNLGTITPKRYMDPDRRLIPYQSEVAQMISDGPHTVAEICDKLIAAGHPCETSDERRMLRDKIKNHLTRKIKRGWVVKDGCRYRLTDELAAARVSQQ